ncbi:hypothetical protein [Rhizobium terrae]|uniref:hypothetical protein n=1 Tax=Rhizobium terrae TaxID=2171756 RepID=UPI000E3B6191|nr:hypothetical protein [Rhizobium terrae]
MNLLGVRLNMLIGPAPVALPAPVGVLEALTEVEVTHSDRERSGFRLSFAIGRGGPLEFLDYELVANPLLAVGARVVLTVVFDITPRVIMDGIVTKRDVVPGDQPGQGVLVLTGDDISILFEKEEKRIEHPAQAEPVIVAKIAASYAEYLVAPLPTPPPALDQPIPVDRTPVQCGSDWDYLHEMAERYGFVTFIEAGPAPLSNMLYWGPPVRIGLPQKALNVNLGPITNVSSVSLSENLLATKFVSSKVKDRLTGQEVPVIALMPTRPPLGAVPTTLTNMSMTRQVGMETSGLNAMQALARALGQLDASSDDTVTVSGTLDSVAYNDVLKARALVDLRGAGFSFDGTYVVRSVTHRLARGGYSQDFSLSRAELGALSPLVRVA